MQQHGGFVQPGPLEGSKLTLPAQTLAGNDGSYRDQAKAITLGTGLSMSGGVLRAVGSAFDGAVATWADLPVGLVTPVLESVYLVRNGSGVWLLNRKQSGLWQRVALTGDRAADWSYLGEWLEEFSDANFEVWHNDDTSRGLKFSLADQATGTTVTVRSNDLAALGTMAAGWSGVSGHLLRIDNPHAVTAAQVGLGSVDNTRDADKPVSTAQAAAIGARAPLVHGHAAEDISDSTYVGRGLLTAASAAVQRGLLGLTGWAANQWTNGTTDDVPEGARLYFTEARANSCAATAVSTHNTATDSHADLRESLAGKQAAGSYLTTSTLYAGSSSPGGAATTALACTGNSATATKLATARTLTIGSTVKTFDGSANVAWTLAEMGAAQKPSSGTWTPVLTADTPPTGVVLQYVYADFFIFEGWCWGTFGFQISNIGTGGAGRIKISGLPVTATSAYTAFARPQFAINHNATTQLYQIPPGVNYIYATGAVPLYQTLANNYYIQGQCFFKTA